MTPVRYVSHDGAFETAKQMLASDIPIGSARRVEIDRVIQNSEAAYY